MIALALSLYGCSDHIDQDVFVEPSAKEIPPTRSSETDPSNHVSYSDIKRLIGIERESNRQMSKATSTISCIVDSQSDTLLYVLDKATGGWCIYSSDTRVPHIVAYSETGSFSDLMQIEGANLWLQSISADMKTIKSLDQRYLRFSDSEIKDNQCFWKSISNPQQYVINTLDKSKVVRLDTVNIKPHPFITGHYEYYSSYSYWEDYDEIPRLTTTNWHQLNPFNIYCPSKATDIGRAPAGCVAISAAQMMFFLHHKYGVPRTAPSKAYCNGYVNSADYDWAQTDYNSEIWDKMKTNERAAAPLIADIGRRVGMKYGDLQSSAATKDLVQKVFKPYGISSTYTSYNTDLVKTNLTNGLPIIISAYSNVENQQKHAGHSFIIDRYKRTREVVKNVYRWVYDYVPEGVLIEYVQDSITTTYRNPEISMIGMNWGFKPNEVCNDYGWFALTGDWYVDIGDQNMNWNIRREILYITGVNF